MTFWWGLLAGGLAMLILPDWFAALLIVAGAAVAFFVHRAGDGDSAT